MQFGRYAKLLTVVAMASLWGDIAAADETTITVSGYGTIGGTLTSDGNFAYRHDSTEFIGATNQLDIGVDSRLGVQAVLEYGDSLSVTAQEVFKRRGSSNFDPGTEWFYAQYSFTPYVDVRLGRVAIDTFLLSDSINVGYAAIWFNAPNEIYASEPFKFLDGAQGHWATYLGDVKVKLEGAFGQSSVNLIVGGQTVIQSAKNAANAALSIEYRNWLLRVAYTDISAPLTLPLGATHSLTYTTHDHFAAIGSRYDDGRAVLLGEWTHRTQNDIPTLGKPLAAGAEYYAAAGWHLHKFTPMVVFGVYRSSSQLIAPPGEYKSWTGVLRYDLFHNVALKAQVTRTGAGNTRFWVTPNFTSNENVNVYSFGADFVF
jgi:hypothetical protein